MSTMIATVLDQPSPLRAVEHPKSKIVYQGARASNISADPRIAVIDKDCISFQKATDNPCAWKERLSLNTANRLSVFLNVADIPPRTSIARGTIFRIFCMTMDREALLNLIGFHIPNLWFSIYFPFDLLFNQPIKLGYVFFD